MTVRRFQWAIQGLTPLRTHSAALADNLDTYAKAIKGLSKKRNKTEEDERELNRLEARGGMYVNNGKVVLPAGNIKAALVDAAKSERKGESAKRSLQVGNDVQFSFDGPTSPDDRAVDPACYDRRIVSLNPQRGTKGSRTRPIFSGWAASGTVLLDDVGIDPKDVERFLALVGLMGLCEKHGGFGQFEVKKFEELG